MDCPACATFSEKHRRLTCRVSGAHYRHVLIVVKNSFNAGASVMNSGRFKSLCALNVELPPADARRSQNRTGAELSATIEMERMKIVRTGCGIDVIHNDRRNHFCPELEHLQNSARGEVVSREPVWKTDEVLNSGRRGRLPAGTEPIEHCLLYTSDAADE